MMMIRLIKRKNGKEKDSHKAKGDSEMERERGGQTA